VYRSRRSPCAGDLRPRPLGELKARLANVLGGKPGGILFNEHTDEDGATVFRHACKLGFEGIVSKRLSAPYRSGPSRDWIKVKNPDSPRDATPPGRCLVALGSNFIDSVAMANQPPRRFPPPWRVDKIPAGYVVQRQRPGSRLRLLARQRGRSPAGEGADQG
jgi:hypothetical protein